MTDTFTWRADIELSGTTEFTMSGSTFGDGYKQQLPLGLNNKRKTFTVSVTDRKSVIAAVKTFLNAQNGLPFFWRPPFGVTGEKYTCQRYNEPSDLGGGWYRISMDFVQDFSP